MNKKINVNLLFIFSFTILVLLQIYYVRNAYLLKERELNQEIKIIANSVIKQIDLINKVNNEEEVVRNIKLLIKDEKNANTAVKNIQNYYRSKQYYSPEIDKLLRTEIKKNDFVIAFQNEIYSIHDNLGNIELLDKRDPIILFKSKNNVKNGQIINEGLWNSNQSIRDTEIKEDQSYHFIIKSHTQIELLNMRILILKEIALLIILSLLISSIIAYLFWKSLKNLRLQKQHISQLHTTIDSIAHELNTPITTLKFSTVNVENEDLKKIINRQIHRIEGIASSIHHQQHSSDLLTVNNIENYMNDIRAQFSNLQIFTNINFDYNHKLYKNDFELILNNLIENSVKYKSHQIHIDIHFNKQICIEISDDGIGIPSAEQQHVFQKYYRVSRVENLQINGLGIGLYIVKQVIEQYKGQITVKSNAPSGVSFKILIANEN